MESLTVVIQAGGASRRMGQPKPLVAFCGSPLICRSVKRLHNFADELIVTSNQPDSLDFLHTCNCICQNHGESGRDPGLRIVSDLYPERSALNGIYTALYYATQPYVAIVACDMVFPSGAILAAQAHILELTGADIAVPYSSHGFEPFHAVYRRETCLPVVKRHLEAGDQRANCFFDELKTIKLGRKELRAIDPRGGTFINVNRPDELAKLEKRIWAGRMTKLPN
jgi:molybdopterin-guanine dinucleotide biosynthesis protein A